MVAVAAPHQGLAGRGQPAAASDVALGHLGNRGAGHHLLVDCGPMGPSLDHRPSRLHSERLVPQGGPDASVVVLHSQRFLSPGRQHVLSSDLRRQRGGRPGVVEISPLALGRSLSGGGIPRGVRSAGRRAAHRCQRRRQRRPRLLCRGVSLRQDRSGSRLALVVIQPPHAGLDGASGLHALSGVGHPVSVGRGDVHLTSGSCGRIGGGTEGRDKLAGAVKNLPVFRCRLGLGRGKSGDNQKNYDAGGHEPPREPAPTLDLARHPSPPLSYVLLLLSLLTNRCIPALPPCQAQNIQECFYTKNYRGTLTVPRH